MSPQLQAILIRVGLVLAAAAVGALAVFALKDTPLYEPVLVAAGSLLGLPVPDPAKALTSRPPAGE